MPDTDGTLAEGPVTDEQMVELLMQPEAAPKKAAKKVVEAVAEEIEAVVDDAADEPVDEADDDAEMAEEDADEADDDDAEEDADELEDEPDDSRHTVKVDGQEFEVTLDELKAGYQKGADYHRKTAALAEERRAFQGQAQQQMEQLRSQYAAALEEFTQGQKTEEPDWVKLSNELDPWEYQRQRAEWDHSVRVRGQAQQQAQEIKTQQHMGVVADQTARLLESFPEWKSVEAFETDRNAMMQEAMKFGFTQQEFMGAVDHRVFKLLKAAMRGQKIQSTPPAKKLPKPATKVMRPGVQETSAMRSTTKKASLREDLRRKGDDESAVKYLLGG